MPSKRARISGSDDEKPSSQEEKGDSSGEEGPSPGRRKKKLMIESENSDEDPAPEESQSGRGVVYRLLFASDLFFSKFVKMFIS